MTDRDIAKILTRIGDGAVSAAPSLGGTWGTVLGGVGAGLSLVGDLIALGQSPQVQINAIRDLNPDLAKLRDDRERQRQAAVAAHAKP